MAIVLRVIDFSETSAVVTLFTKDFGKVSALAKGAHRPKGPFESALDLLAVVRILFLRKSSDALDLLTEAKLERRFRAASRDLSRLYAGYYVAELLMELTDAGDPHPELYAAADEALLALEGTAAVAGIVLRFELAALQTLGHMPELEVCVGCGASIDGDGRVAFGQLAGGVLCPKCRSGQRQVVSMSSGALAALRGLVASPTETEGAEIERGETERNVRSEFRGELRGVMNHYLAHLIGHKPRMHDYLSSLSGIASE